MATSSHYRRMEMFRFVSISHVALYQITRCQFPVTESHVRVVNTSASCSIGVVFNPSLFTYLPDVISFQLYTPEVVGV
jgi:hypothetical protein